MDSITIIMFGWKMCSKFNFIAIFLILVNFAAFLDHTKENADVNRNDGQFQVNYYVYRKYMPEAISTKFGHSTCYQSRVRWGGGLFCPPPQPK